MFNKEEKTTEQLIKERFQEIPEVIRDVITDSDWRERLGRIISSNNLLIDQGLAIETETLLMMLGIESPKDYAKNIKKEANLENNQTIKIATEVNDQILKELKKKIVEESYRESGRKENEVDNLLGYEEELEEKIPPIDTDDIEPENQDRNKLVGELEKDITIDDGVEEESSDETKEEKEDVYNYKSRPELDPDLVPRADDEVSRLESVEQKVEVPEKPTKEDLWKDAAKNYESRPELGPDLVPRADKNTSRIELDGSETKNDNTIEYEPLKEEGPLPDLTPLRTLERDTDTLKGRPHRKSDVIEKLDDDGVLINKEEKKEETKKEGVVPQQSEAAHEPGTEPEKEPESQSPAPTQEIPKPQEVETQQEVVLESEKNLVPENIPTEESQKTVEENLVVRPERLEPQETQTENKQTPELQTPPPLEEEPAPTQEIPKPQEVETQQETTASLKNQKSTPEPVKENPETPQTPTSQQTEGDPYRESTE